ncbi:unnamed protein product [Paramecium pentaurelia]|uniref:Uncharacterized protein n=1 Tax=Paramecium pentaurelia TaxID=43138 RepID=A0A8S1T7N5_9CILI|nr:unnamed protein product [Paramecium pentaurelia]
MFQKILNQQVMHQVGRHEQKSSKRNEVVDKEIKTLHEVFNWKAHLKMNQFVKQFFRKIRMKLLHPFILINLRINQNKYNNLQQKNWHINNSPLKKQQYISINASIPYKSKSCWKRNKMRQEKLEQQKIIQDIRYKNRKILQELHHINVLKMKHVFFTHDENKDENNLNVTLS